MTLNAEEFIRRFLLHILPSGFRKIRHYGLFAFRDKVRRLALCRKLTNTTQPKSQQLWSVCKKSWAENLTFVPVVVRDSFPETRLLLSHILHKLLKSPFSGEGELMPFFLLMRFELTVFTC